MTPEQLPAGENDQPSDRSDEKLINRLSERLGALLRETRIGRFVDGFRDYVNSALHGEEEPS